MHLKMGVHLPGPTQISPVRPYNALATCGHVRVRPKFEFPAHKRKTWAHNLICTSSKQNSSFWTFKKVLCLFRKSGLKISLAVLPVVTCLCCEQCPYDSTSHPYKIVLTLIEAEYYCLCNLFHWETKYFELRMLCVVTVIGLVFGLFVEKVMRFPCQVWLAKGTLQGKEEVSRHLKWTLNLVLRS